MLETSQRRKRKQREKKKFTQSAPEAWTGIPISGDGAEDDHDLELILGRGAKPDTSSLH
jgi:hypothetical protein